MLYKISALPAKGKKRRKKDKKPPAEAGVFLSFSGRLFPLTGSAEIVCSTQSAYKKINWLWGFLSYGFYWYPDVYSVYRITAARLRVEQFQFVMVFSIDVPPLVVQRGTINQERFHIEKSGDLHFWRGASRGRWGFPLPYPYIYIYVEKTRRFVFYWQSLPASV